MGWFGMGGFGWSGPEWVQEFQTQDWEAEMNELQFVIWFLFLSNIFKKQFRKTDLSLCCVVKSATLPPVRRFYIKKNPKNQKPKKTKKPKTKPTNQTNKKPDVWGN